MFPGSPMSHKQREQICRWFQEDALVPQARWQGGQKVCASVVLMIVLGMTTARVTILTCQPHVLCLMLTHTPNHCWLHPTFLK